MSFRMCICELFSERVKCAQAIARNPTWRDGFGALWLRILYSATPTHSTHTEIGCDTHTPSLTHTHHISCSAIRSSSGGAESSSVRL